MANSQHSVDALVVARRILKRLALVNVIYVIMVCISSFCGIILLMTLWSNFAETGLEQPGVMGWISTRGYDLYRVISGWKVPILAPGLIYYVLLCFGMIIIMMIGHFLAREIIWVDVTKGSKKIQGTLADYYRETCKRVKKKTDTESGLFMDIFLSVLGFAASYLCIILLILRSYGWEYGWEALCKWVVIGGLIGSLIVFALPMGCVLLWMDACGMGPCGYVSEYVFNCEDDLKDWEKMWAEYNSSGKKSLRRLAVLKKRQRDAEIQRYDAKCAVYGTIPFSSSSSSSSYSSSSSSSSSYSSSSYTTSDEEKKKFNDLCDDLDMMEHMRQEYGEDWCKDV